MNRNPEQVLILFGLSLVTLAAIVILVVIAMWIRSRWFDNEDPAGSTTNLLLEYREMLRRGELTDEEYRLIKSRLFSQAGGNPPPVSEPGAREAGPLHDSPETNTTT